MMNKTTKFSILKSYWYKWSNLFDKFPKWLFAPEARHYPERLTRKELRNRLLHDTPDLHERTTEREAIVDKLMEIEIKRVESIIIDRKNFHEETSRTIRRIFYGIMATCLFCLITLTSESDIQLLIPNSKITLPILNYKMGFDAFLLVGPVVLVGLGIYLHIFVAEHRRFALPVENVQPILPNFAGWTSKLTMLFIFYWTIPITLAVFAWKAWPASLGGILTYLTFGVAAVSIVLQLRRSPQRWRGWAIPLLIVFYAGFIHSFKYITDHRQLSLFKADLSSKDLRSVPLVGANLVEATLKNANLSGADLSRADLSNADLTGAILSGANLRYTKLVAANLSNTKLSKAKLENCDLSNANLAGFVGPINIISNCKITGVALKDLEIDFMYLGKHRTIYALAIEDFEMPKKWLEPAPCADCDELEKVPNWQPKFKYDTEKYELIRFDEMDMHEFCTGEKQNENYNDDIVIYIAKKVPKKLTDGDAITDSDNYEKINGEYFAKGFQKFACDETNH